MTIKVGQVSFHHCDTIHGSSPNLSTTDRASLTMLYQGEKNHYQPAYNKHGQRIEISYDKLCRKDEQGYPDYHEPYWYRQLDIRM
jgi:ectoine hydroxylase-related dioxygenase (phytanoyl-CoA dioxygenase family)